MKKIAVTLILVFVILLTFFFVFNHKKSEITVIVRAVGERTEQKVIEYLKRDFGEKNVFVVKDVSPLIEATKKAYSIAMKRNAKWTLFVDADTFIKKENFDVFLKKADEIIEQDEKAFVFQGYLFDKFPQVYRYAGIWLYRTDKLHLLSKYYDFSSPKLKPDDCMVSSLIYDKVGTSYAIDIPIGIHDFFQTSESVLKKYLLRASRLAQKLTVWKKNWKDLSKTDADFYWALKGLEMYESLEDKNIKNDSRWIDELVKKQNIVFPKNDELKDEEIKKVLDMYVKPIEGDIPFYRSRKEAREII